MMRVFKLKTVVPILLLWLVALPITAQFPEGEALFKRGEYAKAEAYYQKQLKQNPSSMTLRYRTGKCQLLQKHYAEAVATLEPLKSRSNSPKELYILLGEAYFGCYRFDESVESFETYRNKNGEEDVTSALRRSRMASDMLKSVDDIVVVDSVVVDLEKILSIYHLSKDIGALYASGEGKTFLTGCQTGRNDRRVFAVDCDSTISLYESFGLLDGSWSSPTPLSGSVNSMNNQNFPFVYPDGVTLYFASDDPSGMGGYDIYRANSNGNGYLEPRNVGFPYNSTANDYLMVVDEYTGIGWFATDRRQPSGKVMVYTFIPNTIRKNFEGTSAESILRAQMIGYEVSDKKPQYEKETETAGGDKKSEPFVINNQLTYYSANDFKSDDARNHYSQYVIVKQLLAQLEIQLASLRADFSKSFDEEKKKISDKIVSLEQQQITLRAALKKEQKLARNLEIAWLESQN